MLLVVPHASIWTLPWALTRKASPWMMLMADAHVVCWRPGAGQAAGSWCCGVVES
ncbi:hypothetical protein [Micromonospora sp. NBC_01638]|uniref:hypothetical protein n=1 Tax=Micromonospora sp. NBC_01638 TaxID=2975982 RepID=UPI00386A39A5|nr:hypothetical protein OG811_13745 [Micromonospora sp. NBC_01638]